MKLFFRKKAFIFEIKDQKMITSLNYNQLKFISPNYTLKEYEINMTEWKYRKQKLTV